MHLGNNQERMDTMKEKSQYKRYTRSRLGSVLIFIFLSVMGLISVLPMIYCVCTAFKPLDELLVFPPRFFVHRPTLENFTIIPSLLGSLHVPFSRYIFNSFFVTIITTLLQIIVATAAAFVFSKTKIKGRIVIFLVVQFSLLYNGQTLGIPQYVILNWMRIIDTYLVYILPAIPSSMGVFLIKQYMDASIPDTLIEAAKIDGASLIRTYHSIVMPITKPAWMTLFLFAFQSMWSSMGSGTIFSEELKTLPYVMSSVAAGGIARAGAAMAVTVILLIPPVVVYFISQSNVMETMSSAGMKG